LFFLLKYISEKTNVKVLLSGEGLDELCGYSNLFNLNDLDFQTKSIDLLNNLSKYELLRSDKISGSMGLELRYPFLDKNFVEYILTIHPLLKRPQISSFSKVPIEKYIIRKAFDNLSIPNGFFIDRDILWASRQDINSSINELPLRLHNYYDTYYTDIDFFNCLNDIIEPKPNTKEDMHYRKLFDKIYPNTSNILNYYWNSIWKF
jgi:asparagine synthase (glutamine-hydrolysing)